MNNAIITRPVEIKYKCGHAATLTIRAHTEEQVGKKVRFFESLSCPKCRERMRAG